jgi:hypothetical protein
MLEPLPPSFRATVAALHLVASELVAPARKPQNEIALIATPGGFGTPRFEFDGCERQVRVEGAELVQDCGGRGERRAPLTSLAAGAEAITELLPLDAAPSAEPLKIDAGASRSLGGVYGFGDSILARLREMAAPEDDPSPAYLWPEHFDIAIELGSEAHGTRANYGLSPGDEQHDEPYLYVGPWSAPVEGESWNARGFSGAELSYSQLLHAGDQEAAAIEFFAGRREALAALASG